MSYKKEFNEVFNYLSSLTSSLASGKDVLHLSYRVVDGCAVGNDPAISSLVLSDDFGKISVIGKSAFKNYKSLVSVKFPSGLSIIESEAFFGCRRLSEISIPNSVERIEDNAFSCCSNLESITFAKGSNLSYLGCFYQCSSLQSIVIPEGVTVLGADTFYKCVNLSEIRFPSTLHTIVPSDGSKGIFTGCFSLEKIFLHSSIDSSFFKRDDLGFFGGFDLFKKLIVSFD